MSNKGNQNPFKSVKLTKETPHAEVIFDVATGVTVRATFNLSSHIGRLSRGTIGIWDAGTGRFQQIIKKNTHKFGDTMTKDLIIPAPAANESQQDIIERTTRQAAHKLFNKYRPQILGAVRENKTLVNYSLAQVLEVYGADYISDRSNSAEMRKTYLRQLEKLANSIGEKPLKDITKKDLTNFCKGHKGENGPEYISNFQSFLQDTAFRIGLEQPCKDALEAFFRDVNKAQKANQKNSPPRADVLPQEFEAKLDQGCWDNLGDPSWGCTVVVKEGGLDPSEVCKLRIKDVFRGETLEEVYILLRKDNIATYTNDYSFPLSPFGGSYIAEYLAMLENTCPPERVNGEKFLFAADEKGDVPLCANEITEFIRVQLSRYLFGYAGHIAMKNGKALSMGVKLLKDTRKKHLQEDCRFDEDRGAILFLLHLSLSRLLQADSYRCFTDMFGRKALFKRLLQDRHGCRESGLVKYSRMSNVIRDDVRELHFPPKNTSCPGQDEIITLTIEGLELGDLVEVIGTEGCYVSID